MYFEDKQHRYGWSCNIMQRKQQALCRDDPPKLWIVARAHALLYCSTLLVAHIKSEFAKCTFAEVSQTRPLHASAASACTDRRAHTAYLCVCVDVV